MSRIRFYALFLIISIYFLSTSCQKDNYEEPKLIPKTYSFNIPNKVSFNFSQLSENRESVIPYSNSLSLKNISSSDFSGSYVVFAFKETQLNYNNIAFINRGNFDTVSVNGNSESISLETSDKLFTADNLIASILNFSSADSDHNLNGLYTGELNIYSPADDEPTFIRSITCTGIIDFEGRFHFLIHNSEENDAVRLKGNLNSNNLVSGNIINSIDENLSSVINVENEPFILSDNNLTGSLIYTKDAEQRILKFNLTKQN